MNEEFSNNEAREEAAGIQRAQKEGETESDKTESWGQSALPAIQAVRVGEVVLFGHLKAQAHSSVGRLFARQPHMVTVRTYEVSKRPRGFGGHGRRDGEVLI